MRILQLTPGTGNFHCGSCCRDNSLVRGLRARGHAVTMVPLYLPLVTDTPAENQEIPIFLGGISMFLEQKFPLFRHTPKWLSRALSAPAVLGLAANLAGMTSARQLGEAAVAMLHSTPERQAPEVERLVTWLRSQPPPDVICLSNSLLGGLVQCLKATFKVPIVSTWQGEDSFLDGLPEPYRGQAWALLAQRCAEMDHFIAVSDYYADHMRRRLNVPAGKVTRVYPGIDIGDFQPVPTPPAPPVLLYLARYTPAKGLGTLVDAFLQLKQRNRVPGLRLRVGGAMVGEDKRYADSLKQRLKQFRHEVEFCPNLARAEKIEFLRTGTVLSVPATYGEAFGLYLLEAWASGVPVVQPRHGAFPELIERTGGGLLCAPDEPAALADTLESLLLDPAKIRSLGEAGRSGVRAFTVETMAEQTETVLKEVVHAA